jgi:hypothetical protein
VKNSIVHSREIEENNLARHLFPDGSVPWDEPIAPDLESGDERRLSGRIRMCSYCGSMHPTDVVAAIKAGAQGEWADMKYGWPHKSYFTGVPNPHVGLLESRHTASYQHREDWIQLGERSWRAPGEPAEATLMWKFYSSPPAGCYARRKGTDREPPRRAFRVYG